MNFNEASRKLLHVTNSKFRDFNLDGLRTCGLPTPENCPSDASFVVTHYLSCNEKIRIMRHPIRSTMVLGNIIFVFIKLEVLCFVYKLKY